MIFSKHRRAGGFTVVELLITLAVAAILLAVVVPGFQAMVFNNRTTAQADEFLAVVQTARSEALKRSTPVRLTAIDPDTSGKNEWGKGVRLWIDENSDGEFDAITEPSEGDVADTVVALFDVLESSHTLDSDGDNAELIFSPSGRASHTDRFFLCGRENQGFGREIYVTRTGRVGIAEHECE